MVLVLKKEVVKTNNSVEHDDVGKYRQLLVRTLHQCTVKFPDVANTIIPVVSKHTDGRTYMCVTAYVATIHFSVSLTFSVAECFYVEHRINCGGVPCKCRYM